MKAHINSNSEESSPSLKDVFPETKRLRTDTSSLKTILSYSSRPRPCPSAWKSTAILRVGERADEYIIHPAILSLHSAFFAAAFRPDGFKEGRENVLDLPKERQQVVESYLHWAYFGEIYQTQVDDLEIDLEAEENWEVVRFARLPTPPSSPLISKADVYMVSPEPPSTRLGSNVATSTTQIDASSSPPSSPSSAATLVSERQHSISGDSLLSTVSTVSSTSPAEKKLIPPAYGPLIRLYDFADRLCIPALKRAIIEKVAFVSDSTNSCPNANDTWLLFEETAPEPPGKGLRALVVDLFAWKKTNKLINTHLGNWHPDFLAQLVVKLGIRLGKGTGTDSDGSESGSEKKGISSASDKGPWKGAYGCDKYFCESDKVSREAWRYASPKKETDSRVNLPDLANLQLVEEST